MVITKDAVERFSHPSHRFRVQAGFLWSHCQFCAHIIQHAELHSKLERQCHLPDFYIPSPLSQSLDCSEERSCSSLPKHRSVKSFLCSTYHFYKPENRPGSVCQRRRSPYHSRRVARATLAAADCRQEPSTTSFLFSAFSHTYIFIIWGSDFPPSSSSHFQGSVDLLPLLYRLSKSLTTLENLTDIYQPNGKNN